MGDDQDDVGIAIADLANLADVVGMSQTGGFGHVQGHPEMTIVEDFQDVSGQEIEDASFEVFIAGVGVVADQGIVGLDADHVRPIEEFGDFFGGPLRADDRQVPPGALLGFELQILVCRIDVEVEGGAGEGDEVDLSIGEDGGQAVGGGGGIAGPGHLVDPVLAFHLLGGVLELILLAADVDMGVDDFFRQPVREMFIEERTIDIGVVPNVSEVDFNGYLVRGASVGNDTTYCWKRS